MNAPPSGTVTFLFTDIEGSTKLWERYPEAMQPVLARHDAILRAAVLDHAGYIVKMRGDGIHAAFSSAPDALRAVLAAQRALHTAEWGDVGALRVRAALHTASVEQRDGDYFGPPVNRAARLLAAAHGGQTLLSTVTQELVRDDLPDGLTLADLGLHRLKDLIRPERIYQAVAPDLPAEFPPPVTLSTLPCVLPIQLTPFIGREQELTECLALLRRRSVRLLTLTGAGGTGKTRLGLQAAADIVDEFANGVFFVDLSLVSDPQLVPRAIARVLQIPNLADVDTMTSLRSYLHEKQVLLLLDNFEHLTAAATVVSDLLMACEQLKVLATSRAPLHLVMEYEYPVPALALPDMRRLPPLPVLSQFEAVALFIERTVAVKPSFRVTNASAPAVAEICVRLDGLPLAIELAAARGKLMTPRLLLHKLQQGLAVLDGGLRDLPARHRTLGATIEWSYRLLSIEEQRVLRCVSVFAGGWMAEAASAVCGRDALDDLLSLADQSLIRRHEQDDGSLRFSMLETVREYALAMLEEEGEAEATRQHHAEYVAAFCEEAEPHTFPREEVEWYDRVERETENLKAGLRWSEEHNRAEVGLRVLNATFWVAHIRGLGVEWHAWYERLLALPSGHEPTLARARALHRLSVLVGSMVEDPQRALPLAEQSYALATQIGATADAALALLWQGWLTGQRDTARGMALMRQARDLGKQTGSLELLLRGAVLEMDATQQWSPGWTAVEPLLEPTMALVRQAGSRSLEAEVLMAKGVYTSRVLKDQPQARRCYREREELFRGLGVRGVLAALVPAYGMPETYYFEGNFGKAEEIFVEAAEKCREYGNAVQQADMLACAGTVAFLGGACDRAKEHCQRSLALVEGRDCWKVLVRDWHYLVLVAIREGDLDAQRHYLRPYLHTLRHNWTRLSTALNGLASSLGSLAAMDPERTARLLGAIEGLETTGHVERPPAAVRGLGEITQRLRRALGDVAVEKLLAQGRTMTREEALDCALEAVAE